MEDNEYIDVLQHQVSHGFYLPRLHADTYANTYICSLTTNMWQQIGLIHCHSKLHFLHMWIYLLWTILTKTFHCRLVASEGCLASSRSNSRTTSQAVLIPSLWRLAIVHVLNGGWEMSVHPTHLDHICDSRTTQLVDLLFAMSMLCYSAIPRSVILLYRSSIVASLASWISHHRSSQKAWLNGKCIRTVLEISFQLLCFLIAQIQNLPKV